AINFGCNILLIPTFHVFGAIIAMNITAFTTTFVLDWFTKPTRKNSKILGSAIKDIILFRSWRIVQ
ncbi:MAG: hypothetical protein K2Q22_13510, partial [Cytophagales bacterium]|nr:hypothetical protein [Cytophagales bacterium]